MGGFLLPFQIPLTQIVCLPYTILVMIAFLSGRVINFLESKIILRTAMGIGYLISINPNKRVMINENLEMYILHVIREDKEELYGFDQIQDRQWIENLLKVNGVGPKAAASIIYTLGHEKVIQALEDKDIEPFCNVKGLGKKTAQKIVLELKGALVDIEEVAHNAQHAGNGNFVSSFTDAMTNLGYKKVQIIGAISKLKQVEFWDETNLLFTIKKGLEVLGR
jgi:holliday junction DNA helicase RuvA